MNIHILWTWVEYIAYCLLPMLCTHAVQYVGTVRDKPDTHNRLTNVAIVGHCFGHQSGLYEISGRKLTSFKDVVGISRLFCVSING